MTVGFEQRAEGSRLYFNTEGQAMITMEPLDDERRRLLPLLLLADESESVVKSYMDRGELFAIRDGDADIGALLLVRDGDAVEVKNLAVAEEHRGRGVGRLAIEFAARWAREAGATRLVVGTADSSLRTMRFYLRNGFRTSGVRPGFFDAYPEEIWEDGMRARNMVMFEMPL